MLSQVKYSLSIYKEIRKFSKISQRQTELMARSLPKKVPLKGVKDVIIVASGKGGVGKSTVSVNLAVSLANTGKKVGILDADIFGPSVPLMMNLHEQPLIDENNLMIPLINYGVKSISMGMLVNQGPVVWRGPLVMSALERLLKGTLWEPLDILIVDTPPGTGDVHLSLAQNIPISGVLLISTPQIAALEVTKRGAEMYKTLKIPILGLVENMSQITCPNCSTIIKLFENSTIKFAKDMGIKVLERLPIENNVTISCDTGQPFSLKYPDSQYSEKFRNLSKTIIECLNNKNFVD